MNCDVIIIGAGPAGSIAAMKLIQAGLKVIVLEKVEFPRYVIGESLLPKSMDVFEDLDLIELLKNENFQIKTGATFHSGEDYCEFLFKYKTAEGWDTTWQVPRERFDTVLIQEAIDRGADVRFNATVNGFENLGGTQRVSYLDSINGEVNLTCKFVIDASGYGRVLPRLLDLTNESSLKPRSAIFCRFDDKDRPTDISNNILHHIHDENTAWSWTIPFSDGITSVGLVVDSEDLQKWISNDFEAFYEIFRSERTFGKRFKNAELSSPVRTLTNYSSNVKKLYGSGYVLCGNATEFIDPIFSSGVCLAITSGFRAAELTIKEILGEEPNWENDYANFLMEGVEVYRTYVNAWYEGDLKTIFFTKQDNHEFKTQICSVLAGFVWDKNNPFVTKHKKILKTIAKVIRINES